MFLTNTVFPHDVGPQTIDVQGCFHRGSMTKTVSLKQIIFYISLEVCGGGGGGGGARVSQAAREIRLLMN